jgi:hypothetical protein
MGQWDWAAVMRKLVSNSVEVLSVVTGGSSVVQDKFRDSSLK